jgi:hypothetical protein
MSTDMSTPEIPDAAPDASAETAAPAADAAADVAPEVVVESPDLTPPAPAALPPAFEGFVPSVPPAAGEPALPGATAAGSAPTAPRVRWAGIVWGLVLAAIAATGVWILTDAQRRTAITTFMLDLTPAAAIAYVVLVVGGFALVAGIVGLARRAQRGIERRRAARASVL